MPPVKGYQTSARYSTNDATFAAEIAGSNAWTKLTGLDQLTPPQNTLTDIEDTDYDSPDETEEYSPGFDSPGEISGRVKYTDVVYAELLGLRGQSKGWKILFADQTANGVTGAHGGGVHANGYVKTVGIPQPDVKGNVYVTFTIKISGQPAAITKQAAV